MTTSTKFAGAAANDTSVGVRAWNNTGNVFSTNSSFAGIGLTAANDETNYLVTSSFGFAIPSGATINGIEVTVVLRNTLSNVTESRARIVKGGTIGSTDKSIGTNWPSTATSRTFGGPTELWGLSWTDTDINASSFGFALSAVRVSGNPSPEIDSVSITVYYTVVAAPTRCGGVVNYNSGFKTAMSSYTWTFTVQDFTSICLVIDVHIFGNATVTALTFDGQAMTLIGARTNAALTQRIESWVLLAPNITAGSVSVTLSGTVDSVCHGAQYRGVSQSVPTEAFTSATGVNAGTNQNCAVTVTSITDNCLIHAAYSLSTPETISNGAWTTRNQVVVGITGPSTQQLDVTTLVTPPGATTVSVSESGTTASWTIVGYALRPYDAPLIVDAVITQAADTVSAAATLAISAASSLTQAADSLTADSTAAIISSLSVTQAGDTLSSGLTVAIVVDLGLTAADDTLFAFAGQITADLAVTQDDNTVTSAVTVAIVADAAITAAGDTLSADGTVAIVADAAVAAAGDTLVGECTVALIADLSFTQASDSYSIEVLTGVAVSVTWTQAADTFTGNATNAIVLTVALPAASDTVASTATSPIVAALDLTAAGDSLGSAVANAIKTVATVTQADNTFTGTALTRVTASIVPYRQANDTIESALGGMYVVANILQAGDTISAGATLAIVATATPTAGGDTLTSASAVGVVASSTWTQAGQSLASIATSRIQASSVISQAANTFTGEVVGGIRAAAVVLAAPDELAGEVTLAVKAANNITQQNDAAVITGTNLIQCSLVLTLIGDEITSTATSRIQAGLDGTQDDQDFESEATVQVRASVTATQAGQTLSSGATVAITADGTLQPAGDSLAAATTMPVTAGMTATQAADTLAAMARNIVRATVNATQDGDTVTAAGTVRIRAAATITESADTLAATAGASGVLGVFQSSVFNSRVFGRAGAF